MRANLGILRKIFGKINSTLKSSVLFFSCEAFDKKIVFIGVGNRVEIWAEEVWNDYSTGANFDNAIAELARLGV